MAKTFGGKINLLRVYLKNNELERSIILSCLFSCLMITARILYTGQLLFIFLLWNLFLAYLPYAIPLLLTQQWIKDKVKFAAAFTCWIIVLPNSFYIITDLFHLGINNDVPLWFDLALIFSFAWNGLVMGVLSIWEMEKRLTLHRKISNEWLFIFPVKCIRHLYRQVFAFQ